MGEWTSPARRSFRRVRGRCSTKEKSSGQYDRVSYVDKEGRGGGRGRERVQRDRN